MRNIFFSARFFSVAALAAGLSLAGCGSGPAEPESKMTSYSGTETKADTASLFSVPQEQMAHLQVVPVEKTRLPRLLRLTGNVTYNAFKTTPVFSAIGGPVHEILVAPGQTVHRGQPLLTVNVKNPPKMTSQIPVMAPVNGEVVERQVGPGQLLLGGATQVFTISDMSTVWVLVNVYQSDMAFVHPGASVGITTASYAEVFHGKISYIAPALDPNTRTLQARIVTANPGKKLKKDMYVTATVQAGAIRDALTVPDAAVLRDTENQPFVYAQTKVSNQFERRLVKIGDSQAGRTQITDGLKEGEHVVGDGSLFLQFKNSLQH